MGSRGAHLLLLLASLWSVQAQWEQGYLWKYRYAARQCSSLSRNHNQYSAVAIKCQLWVQQFENQVLEVNLTNCEYGELHNQASSHSCEHTPISYSPLPPELSRVISMPCHVQLSRGLISQVTCDAKETVHSMNLKKAVLSRLQMDWEGRSSLDRSKLNAPQPQGRAPPYFVVMEKTEGGECRTTVMVTPPINELYKRQTLHDLRRKFPDIHLPPEVMKAPLRFVYKVNDYERTHDRSTWIHQMPANRNNYLCYAGACLQTPSNRSTTVSYILSGYRAADARILKIIAESQTVLSPLTYRTTQMWTKTNQTFVNIGSERSRNQKTVIPNPQVHRNLTFLLPTSDKQPLRKPDPRSEIVQLSMFSPGSPIPKLTKAELQQKIWQSLQTIEQQVGKPVPDEGYTVTGSLLEMEKAIALLPYSSLKSIFSSVHTQRQREIYYHMLVGTGTPAALSVIFEAIENKQVDSWLANWLIARMPMHSKIFVPKTVQELMSLMQSPVVSSSKQLHSTTVLALGKIFNQLCVNNATVDKSYPTSAYGPLCTDQVQEMMLNLITKCEQYAQAEHSAWRAAYLRAIGLTGHPKAVEVLEKFIYGQQTPEIVSAIYALGVIAGKQPQLVSRVLMGKFNDPSSNNQERGAAFVIWLECNPGIYEMQSVAIRMWHIKNVQLRSLVYSAFKSLSESPRPEFPRLHAMSCKATTVLPIVPRPPNALLYSSHYFWSTVLPRTQTGYDGLWSSQFNPRSVIPQELYARLSPYKEGYVYKAIEQSLTLQNVQKHIIALFNSSETPVSWPSLPQPVKKVLENLSVWNAKLNEWPTNVSSYTSLMESMNYFFTAQWHDIKQKIPTGDNFYNISKVVVLNIEDRTVQSESGIGMATIVTNKSPVLISINGLFRILNKPESGRIIVEFKNIHTSLFGKARSEMSTVSPATHKQLGIGLDLDVVVRPDISFAVSIDKRTQVVELSANISQTSSPLHVFQYREMPYTIGGPVTSFDPAVPSPSKQPIQPDTPLWRVIKFGQPEQISGKIEAKGQVPLSYAELYQRYRESMSTGARKAYFTNVQQREIKVILDMPRSRVSKVAAVIAPQVNVSQPIPAPPAWSVVPRELWTRLQHQITVAKQELLKYPHQEPVEFYGKAIAAASGSYPLTSSTPAGKAGVYALFALNPKQRSIHYELKYGSIEHQLCANGEYVPPQTSSDRHTLLRSPTKASVTSTVQFGRQSCSEQSIQMKANLETDPKAIEFASSCPAARQCEQHEQQGNPSSSTCELAKDYAAMLSKVDVVIKASQLSDTAWNYSSKVDQLLKYIGYPYMDSNPQQVNTSNQVGVTVHFDPYLNCINASVYKPHERNVFSPIYLPWEARSKPIGFCLRHSVQQKMCEALNGAEKHNCRYDRSVLKTFDNVTIPIRGSPSQHTLLAAIQWSPRYYFAVLGRMAGQGPSLTTYVEGHKVEVLSIGQPGAFQVKINGSTPQTLRPFVAVNIPAPRSIGYVYLSSPDTATLCLHRYRLCVDITPKSIIVEPSKLLHAGRFSGACGDFNGEQSLDLVDADFCVRQDKQKFLSSYCVSLPGDSPCPSPHPLSRHRRQRAPEPDSCRKPEPYWP